MLPPFVERIVFITVFCLGPVFLRAERDVFRARTFFGAGGNEKSSSNLSPPSPLFSYFCLNKRVVSADFNRDGFMDFAVVSDGAMPDGAYGNTGIGNLEPGDFFFNRYPALGGDGLPDPSPNVQVGQQVDPWGMISSFNKTGDLAVFLNLPHIGKPGGHFRLAHVSPCNIYAAQEMAVGPLLSTSSTRMDIVVWTGLGGYAPGGIPAFGPSRTARSSVMIYKNNCAFNNVAFTEEILIQRDTFGGPGTECDRPEAGTLADIDNDGFLDIVVACYNPAPGQNSLFSYGNSAGSFDWNPADGVTDAPSPLSVAGAPVTDSNIRKVVSADIDGDGGTDIIFGSDGGPSQLICLHDNGVDFDRKQLANAFPVRAIAVGSLAGNAKLDVVAGGGPLPH